MNNNERDIAIALINEISQLDHIELLTKMSKHSEDNLIVGRSVEVVANLLEKSLNNIHNHLSDFYLIFLPKQFSAGGTTSNIDKVLTDIKNSIQGDNPAIFWKELRLLIGYQLVHGIWYSDVKLESALREEELVEIEKRLMVAVSLANKHRKRVEDLDSTLTKRVNEFDELSGTQKTNLDQITKALQKANEELNSITATKGNAEKVNAEVEAAKTQALQHLKQAEEKLNEIGKGFSEEKKNYSDLIDQIKEDQKTVKIHLKDSEDLYEFVSGKEEEIIRLTGMAADGALGGKYEKRQSDLNKKLPLWLGGVVLSTILALVWIVIVFAVLEPVSDNPWISQSVNLLKTIPGFILVGFVLKQYNRERAIQEEYAFKSAVAMTINAYADLFDENDTEGKKHRFELISNGVKQVHQSPKIHKDRSDTFVSLNTKGLRKAIEHLSEKLSGKNQKESWIEMEQESLTQRPKPGRP